MKAFIFDLDGVIVSTDDLHFLAWKHMADLEGIYFDQNINHRLRGVSRLASLEIILEQAKKSYTDVEKQNLCELKNRYYVSLLETLSSKDILPGVLPTLEYLKKKGYLLAIGSSSKNARIILDKIGLTEYFDVISDGNNITKSKPDPEVFLKAMTMLGLTHRDCAVVEDAEAGIDAANHAQMVSIGVGPASVYQKTQIKLQNILMLKSVRF